MTMLLRRSVIIRLVAIFFIILLLREQLNFFTVGNNKDQLRYSPLSSSSSSNTPTPTTTPTTTTTKKKRNTFLIEFEQKLISDLPGRPPEGTYYIFIPLILENGKLLCRKRHMDQIKGYRMNSFVQMIRKGIQLFQQEQQEQQEQQDKNNSNNNNSNNNKDYDNRDDYLSMMNMINGGGGTSTSLPMLVLENDESGCNVATHQDEIPFPRFTWSIPSLKHQKKFHCNIIPMSSYHYMYRHETDWELSFHNYTKQYPSWTSKINKAIWRGSTTYDTYQYSTSSLQDTPRGQLVQKSYQYPEFIDAKFTQMVQKFAIAKKSYLELINDKLTQMIHKLFFTKSKQEDDKQKNEKQLLFTIGDYISLTDMMKYKAIIDIDGNNWSARFSNLLCFNSVIIKIDPDYIEYFYNDLHPNIHYLSASLENVTSVVQYVIDPKNEQHIQSIISTANTWCKRNMIEDVLAKESIYQLLQWKKHVLDDTFDTTTTTTSSSSSNTTRSRSTTTTTTTSTSSSSWQEEYKMIKHQFDSTINDLVDCDV